MYLILHAFSRRNSGDGLLVDLTLEALEAAGIDRQACEVLALDPDSFSDLAHVHRAPGEPSARPSLRLVGAAFEVLADVFDRALSVSTPVGRVERLARHASGMIAVGGGYLVTDSPVRQLGVLLNHFVQLRVAARAGVPTVYLPQSVGPLRGPVGRWTATLLAQIDRVYARDYETLAEIRAPNVHRCADLAVMKLARRLDSLPDVGTGGGRTVIVGRALPRGGDYVARLQELARSLSSPIWAVQADVRGPRSDRAFYRQFGLQDADTLAQVLEGRQAGVVVSVRLHGAIAALLAGRPAIHLAYERKGWGAFEDLGIAPFVHDARSFDVQQVLAQISELEKDPAHYWSRVRSAVPALREQYAELLSDLRELLVA